MMWHFYEIPYIPDLELVKYQSLGEQGIDGILERHNRFLRQWQRNTVLIHTTLHFFLSYTHERPKGRRLQIFLAFSSDQTVNFESIDALMQASPLADYYKIAPIEDVPVCLRKSFTNILLVKKQEQTRLSTGDTLFTVEGWKSNPKSRLYEMEKTAEALNEDMVYHISIYGSDTYKTAQQALQKPIAILREKALGRSGQITLADNKNRPRDVSAEETLRIYEEFLSDVAKSPCFFANILLYANQKSSAHFLMDAVCGEAIKEGTCEIQEIPSTATPLELQEVNQPYCNLLPPSLAFWPTAYTLDELSSFFRLPILFDGENIEIKKETAPKLEQTGIYLGQTNNGLSAFIDASSFKKHAFICGVPGSGKTNTMLHLANSLWHHKKLIKDDTDNLSVTFKEESDPIPFLVLEPAKREYRELSRYDIPELIILSPSASTKFPMRLNPFEFPKGLTLSEHISKLCQVFEGAFPIAPPAPFILDKAIEGIYRAHGWNTNDINTGEKEYPTMSELYDRFQKELSQTTYDSEIQGNIQSVLEMRIGSLLRREMKDIFDVKHSTSTEQILPIDLLIAQSIKSSKSGSPQEVDTNLDEFLEYYPLICTSSWEDQLFILQKVFAYLKMYSQERKVLEFLVKNNIPRTEQIDRRLNFLKNLNQNDISNAANSIEEFSIQTSDNEIAYDYRFISWTVSEINSYMNLLTSEDKTLDLPMVVAEWNKKIPQKNIRWSTDAMQVYLDKYLHENFGDLYTTKIKNCGAVLSNEVEYEPSVYIEATDSAKYPWLSFVVTGEQLTMTQVSFAIYALYLPTKDSQCTQAVDTIEQNQKYQNRLITLKQAQNPKIKNYIESINEILISGLEAWLNNNNTSSMYD